MNRARFARSGPGVSITIDLDASVEGADEFVAAVAAAVARFGSRGTEEASEAAPSSDSSGPLTNAERCQRRREKARLEKARRAESDTTAVSRDTKTDTSDTKKSVATRVENVAPVSPLTLASASLSGSLPSLSPAFSSFHSEIESETRARGDTENDTATRVATRKTTRSGVAPLEVDLDQEMPDWGHAKIATLNMNLGRPRSPIDFKAEWVGFVAHIGALAASGSPRRVCEAEWQGWLRRTWDKVRTEAERPKPSGRPGNRVIQEPLPEQAHIFNFDDPSLDEARRVARAKREADNAPPNQKPTERKAPR